MKTVGFLACETTLPGNHLRREDAFEHDQMIAALEPALSELGIDLRVIDWEADLTEFEGIRLALLGTAWNYQDKPTEFIAKIGALEACGISVCNPSDVVRWNSRKTYLRELAEQGAAIVPTLWHREIGAAELEEAYYHFDCDKLVVKRQIGAGALGQQLIDKSDLPAADWRFGNPAMLQPFLSTIRSDGEFSFIFIDGELSHALQKLPAKDDYRIQSLYGGVEKAHQPSSSERDQASEIMAALPFETPLYARIDMVPGAGNELLLMEAELVEPYLYPEQGPDLGSRFASAIADRVH